MTPLQIVVAADREMGIGRDGGLPWRLPGEMRHFRTLTTETSAPDRVNAVIMGRKTWQSLPDRFRPLPGRLNVVLSRRGLSDAPADLWVCDSLDAALRRLETATAPTVEHAFVIGGGDIYRETVKRDDCARIYLTRVDGDFDCDTFFELPDGAFTCAERRDPVTENEIRYHIEVLERRADG